MFIGTQSIRSSNQDTPLFQKGKGKFQDIIKKVTVNNFTPNFFYTKTSEDSKAIFHTKAASISQQNYSEQFINEYYNDKRVNAKEAIMKPKKMLSVNNQLLKHLNTGTSMSFTNKLTKTLNRKHTHNRTKSSNDNVVSQKNNLNGIKNTKIQTIYLDKDNIRIDNKKLLYTPFNNHKTKTAITDLKNKDDIIAKFHNNVISYDFKKNKRKYKIGEAHKDSGSNYGEIDKKKAFLSRKRASAPTDFKKDPKREVEGDLKVKQEKASLSIKGKVQLLGKNLIYNPNVNKVLGGELSPKNNKENGSKQEYNPYKIIESIHKQKKESLSTSNSPHYGKREFMFKIHKHTPSLQGRILEDIPGKAKTQKNSLSKLRIASPYMTEGSSLFSFKALKKEPNINESTLILPLSVENINNHQIMKEKEELIELITKYFKEHNEALPTDTSFYRVGRLLGKGAFGKVNLGMHKLTGKLVAIKSIDKQYLNDESSRRKLIQEYSILKKLQHPNILRLYEIFDSTKRTLIVVELCSGGDLLNYVRKHKKLSERMTKFILKKLLEGLHHCHSRGVIHRDIKLDNVLLNEVGELKICDFGVSRIVPKDRLMTEQCGTPAYIAPEILKGDGYEGFAADIWSAGVALYAMLYGTVPFKSNNMNDLHSSILKGKYTLKKGISRKAKDLIRRMLDRNPYKRISISEILSHDWMQDVDDTISLFTDEEKSALGKQYCHTKRSNDSNSLFTEQNIDSTIDGGLKNNTSKSVILGPFNSTRSNLQSSKDYIDTKFPIKDKREMLKFAAKARDIDRQYEKNNNGDTDNGVYNKFVCESTERDPNELPSSSEDEELFNDSIRTRPKSTVNLLFNEKRTLIIGKCNKIIVDEDTLIKTESFGYPRQYIVKCLKDNKLNHATATYYLLTNRYF